MSKNSTTTSNRQVAILDDLNRLDTLRQTWNNLQSGQSYPDVDADIERFNSLFSAESKTQRPYVITLGKNSQVEAMAIGRFSQIRIPCRVGYKTIASPAVKCLIVDGCGILGRVNDSVAATIMKHLTAALKTNKADVLILNHIRPDHPLYQLARTKPPFLCRNAFPRVQPHLKMLLPQSIDDFYRSLSKKHRYNLQRTVRKLKQQFPQSVRIVTFTREDQLDDAIAAASQISGQTYQNALGAGFADDLPTRERLAVAAKQGWLRLSVLYVEDKPRSFQTGLVYHGTYFLEQMAFDPRWEKWDVGTVLFLEILDELCRDDSIESIDFGFGDAQYKRTYANIVWDETSAYIFAPRVRPLFVNTLLTTSTMLSNSLGFVVRRLGIYDQLKSNWRRSLQSQSQADPKQVLDNRPETSTSQSCLDVSIVVVNWNTKDLLEQCLRSIYDQAGAVSYEIIVVDNNSSDGSAEMVSARFPQAKLIVNRQNKGYAAAVNQGINAAASRYILVLNSDVIICEQAIAKTIDFADQHPEAAIIGPQVWQDQSSIQNTCFEKPNLLNFLLRASGLAKFFKYNRFFGREMMLWWDRCTQRNVDVVSGMFLLVRHEAIEQVGPMDESFFLYYEETDWCTRFAKAGWKMIFWPGAKVIHPAGGSHSTNQAALKSYVQQRKSMLIFFRKHYGRVSCLIARIILATDAAIRYCLWTALFGIFRLVAVNCPHEQEQRRRYGAVLRFCLSGREPA